MAEDGPRRRRRTKNVVNIPGKNDEERAEPGSAPDATVESYFESIGEAAKAQGAASTKVAGLYQAFEKAGGHRGAMTKVQQWAKMDETKRRNELRAIMQYVELFGLNDYAQADIEDENGPPAQLAAAG